MSFKEKHELSMSINNLDPEHLGEVVKIISERMPELANNTAPDEIEIDIDALDAITLRCLERFVKSCAAKRRRKKVSLNSPENLTLEDKQLKVVEAAHATSSNIRELERELASLEGRPIPPPIDVPLSLPQKKNQKGKSLSANNATNNEMLSEEDSISDSDLMTSSDDNDELQIVPSTVTSSVSFGIDTQYGLDTSQLLSTQPDNKSNMQQNTSKKMQNGENVVLKNFDQWNLHDSENQQINTTNSNTLFDNSSGELWKKMQTRETINKQKEKERELQEEQLKIERERLERERKEKQDMLEKEKNEKERKIYEERERERMEKERKREEERLKAMEELEQSEKINSNDHHDLESFEKSLGLPFN